MSLVINGNGYKNHIRKNRTTTKAKTWKLQIVASGDKLIAHDHIFTTTEV